MTQHLVSICIPTYNGEKYLQEALGSVKSQTYKNIEVIISDDNSKDNTLKICQNFKDKANFPVYIYHHTPQGIGENWNHCIEKSNGNYIKFLFQDDTLEDKCVEIMMSYLIKNNLEIVFCKRNIIANLNEENQNNVWIEKFGDLQKGINLHFLDFYIFKKKNLILLGDKYKTSYNFLGEPVASLFSKKLYYKTGKFSNHLKQILDLEYWIRVLRNYPIGIINQKLISFRIHQEQTTSKNTLNKVNEEEIIDKFLYRFFLRFLNLKIKKNYIYCKYPIIKKIIALRYITWKKPL